MLSQKIIWRLIYWNGKQWIIEMMKSVVILTISWKIINHSILLDILHVNLVWSIFEKTKYYTFSIPKFFMKYWFPHLKRKIFCSNGMMTCLKPHGLFLKSLFWVIGLVCPPPWWEKERGWFLSYYCDFSFKESLGVI